MESNIDSTFVPTSATPRMSWKGILFLSLCWPLFFALVLVQFLSIGLIPVLAPVLVMVILGQAGLLQRAHQFAERWRTLPVARRTRAADVQARAVGYSR